MKKTTVLFLLLIITSAAFSQGVAINNNGQAADGSAMLDISSTTKGVLIPRMRTDERTAIVAPSRGLIVYDADIQSFWYFTGLAWKEILNSSSSILPQGPASGDLYGSYPSPNVGKIQNLDVAFGVPFDKQVMKWDALNNKWAGLNDSLFLPYNVVSGNPDRLFAITNANTTGGSSAVYGRSGNASSSITPGPSVGVWGESQAGIGVNGSSNSNVGVNGASLQNYGVYGLSFSSSHAGVYGSGGSGPAAAGVLGVAGFGGIGVRGVSSFGKGGVFENTNTSNSDTLLKLVHAGTGRGISLSLTNTANNTGALAINYGGTGQMINLYNSNTANNAHLFYANQTGTGVGIYMSIANTLNTHPGVLVEHAGTGSGIESYGYKGKAGLFQVASVTNASTAIDISTLGTGNAAVVNISNASNNNTALTTSTNGNGSAASFSITKNTNSSPSVTINTNGTGRGVEAIISNASSLAAAVYGSSSGTKGVQGIAQVQGVTGQSTGLTGGIGVYGLSSLNSANGIGVRAESYSTGANSSSGALTAINNSDGTAVYADATGGGIAVYGVASRINGPAVYALNDASQGQALRGSVTGTDGIGIYTESGNGNSSSIAAYFRNNYVNNNRNVVQIVTNGTGKALSIQSTNSANNNEMLRIQNAGSAEFLLCVDELLDTKAYIAKTGNFYTDGTVSVKNGKGIVRNTTGTQLRMETLTAFVPAGNLPHYNEFNSSVTVNITFSTPFSSPPAVYIGNYVTNGGITNLTGYINSVTTTGCVLEYVNRTPYDFTFGSSSVKIIAVGAE